MSDSESSALSQVDSDAYDENEDTEIHDESPMPPAKRQKLSDAPAASPAVHAEPDPEAEPEPDLDGDISSDTSGDVPNSPINAKLDEEEFQEQVTVCAWDGCDAGDQGNMDKLVEHIHNDHIENRQKKYTCEWNGCPRKSMPHASGYALKAHMRSHTREKPFYCYLPECDRAFTRSDALAKHMRTVHETEALRPSDPIPKGGNSQSGAKGNKLKIILKTPQSHGNGHDDSADDGDRGDNASDEFFTQLGVAQGFIPEELAFLPDVEELWRHCVAENKLATLDGHELREACREAEEKYRQEWLEKEVLLDQAVSSEEAWKKRRDAFREAAAEARKAEEAKQAEDINNEGATEEASQDHKDEMAIDAEDTSADQNGKAESPGREVSQPAEADPVTA